MNRFVFVALLVMAWGYWELSGGAGFVPERSLAGAEATVTRADTTELEDLPAVADTAPVIEIAPENIATLTEPTPDPAIAPVSADVIDAVVEDVATDVAPVADPATEAQPVSQPVAAGGDLRVVTGDRVNLREGPGTGFGAIDQLASGTIAEVIETGADGWVRIQVQGTQVSGWMSADFLTPLNG